jgi:hypothetical protein
MSPRVSQGRASALTALAGTAGVLFVVFLFIGLQTLPKFLRVDGWTREQAAQEWRDDGFTYVEYHGEEKQTICTGPYGYDPEACYTGERFVYVDPDDPSQWELQGPERWRGPVNVSLVGTAITLPIALGALIARLRIGRIGTASRSPDSAS